MTIDSCTIALPLTPAGLADGLGLGSVLRLIADSPQNVVPPCRARDARLRHSWRYL